MYGRRHNESWTVTLKQGLIGAVDPPDPLLRLPDEPIDLPPSGLSGQQRLETAFRVAIDHVNLHAMAWPAKDSNGKLSPQPPGQVLHELAHQYDLADEEDLLVTPRLGTVGILTKLFSCSFCDALARYDGMDPSGDRRAGAYMCADHYLGYGSGTLGASGDAYLMLWSEVPQSVQEACNEIRRAQRKDPLFLSWQVTGRTSRQRRMSNGRSSARHSGRSDANPGARLPSSIPAPT